MAIIVNPTYIPQSFQPDPLPTIGQLLAPGLGQASGRAAVALLQALAGQIGSSPSRGQFTAPTGVQTPISPAEAVAPGQPGAGTPLATVLANQQQAGLFPQGASVQGRGLGPTLAHVIQSTFPQDFSSQLQQLQLQRGRQELAQQPSRQQREVLEQQQIQSTIDLNKSIQENIGKAVPIDLPDGSQIFGRITSTGSIVPLPGQTTKQDTPSPSQVSRQSEFDTLPTTASTFKVGEIVERGGKRYKVVGYDTDGEPLVEPTS